MKAANQWIISMIDRLAGQFNCCGFAYGYDSLAEQHIIELSDNETLYTDAFRLEASQELGQFIAAFPDQAMLFIDADNEIPLEPPILYRVQPTHEEVWGSYYVVDETPVAVTFDDRLWQQKSAREVLGSVVYSNEVTQRATVTIGLSSQPSEPGEYNYAMAA